MSDFRYARAACKHRVRVDPRLRLGLAAERHQFVYVLAQRVLIAPAVCGWHIAALRVFV